MRAISVIFLLLELGSPCAISAQPPRLNYTTLIVEYAGEMIRYELPVVISTSTGEAKWYRQHLLPKPGHFLVHVQVVPPSVLNEITEMPLLKQALESAKPVDEEPKTPQNVRFTAGVGHEYAQIIVEKQTSKMILRNIVRVVAKYPSLKIELQDIEHQLR
jgi:hypothetical protein